MNALEDIAAERRRQIEVEGWSIEHDDGHQQGEMARAAAAYALTATMVPSDLRFHKDAVYGMPAFGWSVVASIWPWAAHWFKPRDNRRDLVRAGALIVAEIERLDRSACPICGSDCAGASPPVFDCPKREQR